MSSQIKIIFPIHPRTINRIKQYDLLNQINALNIEMVEPLGYFEFLSKQNNAELIVTDSGGIQEEACILGVPCITLRNNTERPETLEVGSNVITGLDIDKFRENFTRIIRTDKVAWENPYGEGHAGKKIIDILLKELS